MWGCDCAKLMLFRIYCIFLLPVCSSQQVVGSPSNPQRGGEGFCFSDGRRKVDYVLVFHQRRHSSICSPATISASQDRLSIVSNGNFPSVGSDVEAGLGGETAREEALNVRENFVEARGYELPEPGYHEMCLIRQEFEANLLEAGLEIERESEVSVSPFCLFTVTCHLTFRWFLFRSNLFPCENQRDVQRQVCSHRSTYIMVVLSG